MGAPGAFPGAEAAAQRTRQPSHRPMGVPGANGAAAADGAGASLVPGSAAGATAGSLAAPGGLAPFADKWKVSLAGAPPASASAMDDWVRSVAKLPPLLSVLPVRPWLGAFSMSTATTVMVITLTVQYSHTFDGDHSYSTAITVMVITPRVVLVLCSHSVSGSVPAGRGALVLGQPK